MLTVKLGQLQLVEVLQQLLDLIGTVDVGDGVDPVAGGGAAHADVRPHREPAEAPLANTGPAEGGTINSFRERTWHLEYYILGGSHIFKVALFSI